MVGQLGSRGGARLDRSRIVRGAPPPQEGAPVHVDSDAVQLDCPVDRRRRDRQQALLIGDADHEQIGRDGVAEQRGGQARALDDRCPVAGRLPDRALQRLGRQAEVGVAGEVAGHHLVRVDHRVALVGRQREERLLAAGDHQIAAQQQLGAAGRDAHCLDVVRAVGGAQLLLAVISWSPAARRRSYSWRPTRPRGGQRARDDDRRTSPATPISAAPAEALKRAIGKVAGDPRNDRRRAWQPPARDTIATNLFMSRHRLSARPAAGLGGGDRPAIELNHVRNPT